MEGRTQTGLVSCISAQEYDEGIVRKHEFTRPDKEDDRVRNIDSLGAQSGVVFLVHRQQADSREAMRYRFQRILTRLQTRLQIFHISGNLLSAVSGEEMI